MGTKRVGLARIEALIENLKRELALGSGSSVVADKLALSEAGTTVHTELVSTGTTGTIAVTKNVNNAVSVSQPAGTYVKDLLLIAAGDIVTAGSGGDDFDVSIGTTANGTQIMALKALLDDGGAAVTMSANAVIPLISNGIPAAANAFATVGLATNEAMELSAATYSAAARTLHLNFKAPSSGSNLATAATTIKVIAIFATI